MSPKKAYNAFPETLVSCNIGEGKLTGRGKEMFLDENKTVAAGGRECKELLVSFDVLLYLLKAYLNMCCFAAIGLDPWCLCSGQGCLLGGISLSTTPEDWGERLQQEISVPTCFSATIGANELPSRSL